LILGPLVIVFVKFHIGLRFGAFRVFVDADFNVFAFLKTAFILYS
jgi:hypothetical protein